MTANDDEAPTASFEATVHKQGPNAYVDVPESVTHAFSAYAVGRTQQSRRRPQRRLGQRHSRPGGPQRPRLYVTGGMRSAPRVGVGTIRPLFHRIETISPDVHWHVARITEPEQIDALASLLCEAYAVGAQHARLSPAGPR